MTSRLIDILWTKLLFEWSLMRPLTRELIVINVSLRNNSKTISFVFKFCKSHVYYRKSMRMNSSFCLITWFWINPKIRGNDQTPRGTYLFLPCITQTNLIVHLTIILTLACIQIKMKDEKILSLYGNAFVNCFVFIIW